MTLQSDHKALIFLGAIAVLGAGVRMARATNGSVPGVQPALEHQMQAADSAKRAVGGKRRGKTNAPPPSGRVAGIASPAASSGGERAHVGNRLDVDVATATQLDSLPGMSPTLAKRIVADRWQHGPVRNLARLSRVNGVGAKLIQQLDMVMFSGRSSPSSVIRSSRDGTAESKAKTPPLIEKKEATQI